MAKRKLISLMLLVVFVFTLFPAAVPAQTPIQEHTVTYISIGQAFNREGQIEVTEITVTGSRIESVMVVPRGTGKPVVLVDQLPQFHNVFYGTLDQNQIGDSIYINGKEYKVEIGSMPQLSEVKTRRVVRPNGQFKMTGANFSEINGTNVKAEYGRGTSYVSFPPGFFVDNNNAVGTGLNAPPGLKNILFTKSTSTPTGIPVDIKFEFKDQFHLIEELVILNLEMFPNRGEKGDQVFFKGTNLPESSVFFLREIDGTSAYKNSNKARHVSYRDGVLVVEVPEFSGEANFLGEYYVVITNLIADHKDPMKEVWRETVVGKMVDSVFVPERFTVIDGSSKGRILGIQPNQGPDTGSDAEITGLRLGSLNVEGLILSGPSTPVQTISPAGTLLTLDYGSGTYRGRNVTITKEVRVLIANNAIFRSGSTFSTSLDRLLIRTPEVTDAAISPIKDVVVETETTLEAADGETYVFKERMVLPGGYTFITSRITPVLKTVIPDKVPLRGDNTTEMDLWIALDGEFFFVHRHDNKAWLPLVKIAGLPEFNPNIPPGENTPGQISVEMAVLDKDGNVVDGVAGREMGTKILFKLPQGITVPQEGPRDIYVRNPLRNSPTDFINSDTLVSGIRFIKVPVQRVPNIDNVAPNVVATEGGETVRIFGGQFLPGVKVFVEGKEVPNIQRDGSGTVITFTAPSGRPGPTQLQVVNPGVDGGIAVWNFFYVETYTEPEFKSFSPTSGTENTLVVVKGKHFLKPDPSAANVQFNDFEIFKIIGTRIYLGGQDINTYNRDENKKIALRDYMAPEGQELLRLTGEGVELAPYAHSIILERAATAEDPLNYHAIERDIQGRILFFDGFGNRYRIAVNSNTSPGEPPFLAEKIEGPSQGYYGLELDNSDGKQILTVLHQDGSAKFSMSVKTVYQVDSQTGNIVGHRVKVVDSETIYFWVPKMINGHYDVAVVNPDTKSAKGANKFHYREDPQNAPRITVIVPDFGSYEGGYHIEIYGNNFQDTGQFKTRVYIDGVEIAAADTIISSNRRQIKVKVPLHALENFIRKNTNRITVPVVVLNSNGGSFGLENGFAYVIPSSEPRISQIIPGQGSAAGGNIVEILGKEFLFARNAAGELIDAPMVYFGDSRAQVIDCQEGYLRVISPPGRAGNVQVYVLNRDGGISNRDKVYRYIESTPGITSITPSMGRRQGGEWADILGKQFSPGKITLLERDGELTREIEYPGTGGTVRVRFGSVSNEGIPIDQPNSGWISGGNPMVSLAGGLTVQYNVVQGRITLQINEGGKIYKQEFDYNEAERFVNVQQLRDENGAAYQGWEFIRLRVVDRRLIVERGYSPEAQYISPEQIRLRVPSYYTIGRVEVKVINPDGGSAKGNFEYRNPDSRPFIANMTKDGRPPEGETIQNQDALVLRLDYKGGNRIGIAGGDFRENARILIGDFLVIQPNDIHYELPNRLTFTMPGVNEKLVGQYFRVIVENEDGGLAFSDQTRPRPIYLTFIKAESFPSISAISPNRGPAKGGTRVTITGKDFRLDPDGNPPLVFFGEVQVPAHQVNRIDHTRIEVITPANVPGPVEVKVENHDGALSRPGGVFYYISSPAINTVVDPDDPTETRLVTAISVEGGQRIKLKGAGYEAGSRVVFNPQLRQLTPGEAETAKNIIYIDGLPHLFLSGKDAIEVILEDTETLIVKTPEGRLGDKGIIVINPDGGASNLYQNIVYTLPELDAPEGVTAELVYDRFIRVTWSEVPGAHEYEVYVIIDGRGMDFIESTKLTSILYSNLEPRTDYRFVVKAVGSFGSSKPSQQSNTVRTGRTVGYPDTDGAISENTQLTRVGQRADVVIGTMDFDTREIVIDLLRGQLAGSSEVVVSIPASVIANSGARDITVIGRDFTMKFNPGVFNNSAVNSNRSRADAGVRFRIAPVNESLNIPGGNNLSPAYILEASIYIGKENIKVDYLRSFINFSMDFDKAKADMRRLNNLKLHRYDDYKGVWTPVEHTIYEPGSSIITGVKDRLGRYVIIGSRR